MKRALFFIFMLCMCIQMTCAVHADTLVSLYDTDWPNYAYTITGSDSGDSFDLYLSCLEADASIWDGAGVDVTDLGITYQQRHLYQISGLDGQPFWSSGSSIEVLDLSMSRVGVVNTMLDPILWADAGGPYEIAAGQSVSLDSSGSCIAWDYGWNPAESLGVPTMMLSEWKIDGKSVGSLVTFNDLVGTLELSYGIHSVELDVYAIYGDIMDFHESAFSTIYIIPEPATVVLMSLGGMALLRRNRNA